MKIVILTDSDVLKESSVLYQYVIYQFNHIFFFFFVLENDYCNAMENHNEFTC